MKGYTLFTWRCEASRCIKTRELRGVEVILVRGSTIELGGGLRETESIFALNLSGYPPLLTSQWFLERALGRFKAPQLLKHARNSPSPRPLDSFWLLTAGEPLYTSLTLDNLHYTLSLSLFLWKKFFFIVFHHFFFNWKNVFWLFKFYKSDIS